MEHRFQIAHMSDVLVKIFQGVGQGMVVAG